MLTCISVYVDDATQSYIKYGEKYYAFQAPKVHKYGFTFRAKQIGLPSPKITELDLKTGKVMLEFAFGRPGHDEIKGAPHLDIRGETMTITSYLQLVDVTALDVVSFHEQNGGQF